MRLIIGQTANDAARRDAYSIENCERAFALSPLRPLTRAFEPRAAEKRAEKKEHTRLIGVSIAGAVSSAIPIDKERERRRNGSGIFGGILGSGRADGSFGTFSLEMRASGKANVSEAWSMCKC